MSITISDYSNFLFDDIVITQPKKSKKTYKNQFLIKSSDSNADYVYVQTPPLKCCTNIIKGSDGNMFIEVEFPRNDHNFYRFFIELDEQIHKMAIIHSNEWFHKSFKSASELDEHYKSSVINKPSKDLSVIHPPILRINIPVVDDQIICLFDEFGKKFVIDLLTTGNDQILNGKNIIFILHIAGLKFTKRNFSTNIIMFQGKLLYDHIVCMINGNDPHLQLVKENTDKIPVETPPENIIEKLVKNAESKLENSSKEQLLI